MKKKKEIKMRIIERIIIWLTLKIFKLKKLKERLDKDRRKLYDK